MPSVVGFDVNFDFWCLTRLVTMDSGGDSFNNSNFASKIEPFLIVYIEAVPMIFGLTPVHYVNILNINIVYVYSVSPESG